MDRFDIDAARCGPEQVSRGEPPGAIRAGGRGGGGGDADSGKGEGPSGARPSADTHRPNSQDRAGAGAGPLVTLKQY